MTNETRDRRCPLRVVVSASERSRIEERARSAGLSVSAYLRTAGLCHPIRSTFDHAAVMELAKINGDQARRASEIVAGRPARHWGVGARGKPIARPNRRAATPTGRDRRAGMIAMRIVREKGASDFERLGAYVLNARGGVDPASWLRLGAYVLDE